MKSITTWLLGLILLSGCAGNPSIKPPPKDTATISDGFIHPHPKAPRFFIIEQIDYQEVFNAYQRTINAGQGIKFEPLGYTRTVEAKETKFRLTGFIYRNLFVRAVKPYSRERVSGIITFTPLKDETYMVNGKINDHYAGVWIEDTSGRRVSDVLEITIGKPSEAKKTKEQLKQIHRGTFATTKEEHFTTVRTGEPIASVMKKIGAADDIVKRFHHLSRKPTGESNHLYYGFGNIIYSKNMYVKQVIPYAAADTAFMEKLYTLTAEKDYGALRLFIAKYDKAGLSNIEALDILAQTLWRYVINLEDSNEDAMAWICRIIGNSNNGRYRQFLVSVVKNTDNSKITRYAKRAYHALSKTEVEQFTVTP